MSRALRVPVGELIDMARSLPDVFDQLWWEAFERAGAAWKKPGESAQQARDRLRREREELRRTLGADAGQTGRIIP